jgi:glucan-binding YG repeat protein
MKHLPVTFTVIICVFSLTACQENSMKNKETSTTGNQEIIDCSQTPDPQACEQAKRSSKSLKELSESTANKLEVTCSDEFRNENGDCEIPNQEHPERLKKKHIKNNG